MSNLNNLQARLVTLSKQLSAARADAEVNEELMWDLEDEIADIEDEIEGIMQDDYNDKHAAQWR
jgi:hypothetical protein